MTTKHTCGGPVFGRKTKGCPRCDELLAGAKPREWRCAPVSRHEGRAAVAAHFAIGGPHARGLCGPVCTLGDW